MVSMISIDAIRCAIPISFVFERPKNHSGSHNATYLNYISERSIFLQYYPMLKTIAYYLFMFYHMPFEMCVIRELSIR